MGAVFVVLSSSLFQNANLESVWRLPSPKSESVTSEYVALRPGLDGKGTARYLNCLPELVLWMRQMTIKTQNKYSEVRMTGQQSVSEIRTVANYSDATMNE